MNPDQGDSYWQPNQDDPSLSEQSQAPVQAEVESESEADNFDQPLSWQASEYVQHDKAFMWYAALALITVVLLLVSIFLVRSWTFALLIVVMAVSIVALGARPPRVMSYSLSSQGFMVNEKAFTYHDFRAFGVLQDGPLASVMLIPNKRFMPAVHVYFPPEQGEQIVDVFGSFLPMQHVEADLVDKLAQRIRF